MNEKRQNVKKKNTRENKKNIGEKRPAILPPLDGYASRKEWEAVCWKEILKFPNLLELFVTPYERRNLVMRAAALDAVVSGKSYRQISKELWLSLQTISGIKKAISEKGYKSYSERSKKERKKRKYSVSPISLKLGRPAGKPRRTKYGTIYLPY